MMHPDSTKTIRQLTDAISNVFTMANRR